jgi:hypothetical protein
MEDLAACFLFIAMLSTPQAVLQMSLFWLLALASRAPHPFVCIR